MKLIFDEEFNNLDNFVFDIGSGRQGLWGNNEKQFYTSREKNCFIADNKLHIVAYKERYKDCDYTSARLKTLSKFSFKYGYVEVRAKLPNGKGSWPAIWMMGVNDSWPLCGEIDIMEHLGRNQNVIYHTIHCKNHVCKPYFSFNEEVENVSSEFHNYGLLWGKDFIEFYVDRKLCGKIERKSEYKSNDDWPFNNYFYLLINCAVGGDWTGEIDDITLPYEFIIEYIKIWQDDDIYNIINKVNSGVYE